MIKRADPRPEHQPSVCDPTEFVARIQDNLADPDYAWASDTLSQIGDTVDRTGRVSARQLQAIENIERAVADRPRWR